jgi:methyltransferase (TIGR00027 family)
VVILAAGLDARAFRMEWPAGLRLFELDRPDVLRFKDWVLDREGAAPRCVRVVVEADLRQAWAPALRDAGFRPQEPAVWLAEGLMAYLTIQQRDTLLDTVDGLSAQAAHSLSRCKPGSGRPRHAAGRGFPRLRPLHVGAGRPENGERWFGRRGWRAEASDANERAARYGRPMPPFSDPAVVRMLGEGPVATDSVIVGRQP